ncbi:MAG: lipopolysaccharide assembly protein LapB [Gammaproteobacteria bacterium]|nr:MAG: lipopolysaccharide assembly protein LapB [Gammaproteobacteria bacterium]TDJ47061.1 MAG: lipopolysaccharide assembly protein LapB [Gammaproteobacteria bacterium]
MPTEATFILAGLFIVAAGLGWLFARYSVRNHGEPPPPPVNADYLRGLNFVLNRQTDDALELFMRMAKVDDDTLETHFALGHLFRRRGEVERAIRVHQNLLARPNLNESQRHQALFSLAQDYLGAGLFDRAEKLFSELRGSPTLGQAALENLVDIYERESDWTKAIEAHRELEVMTGEKSSQVAHYYCELAERARLSGNLDLARQYLKSSVRSETGAFRGTLIRAAIAQEEEDFAQALRLYEQVLETDQRLMVEVLPQLVACYEATNRQQELERYLERLIAKGDDVKKNLAFAVIINGLTAPPIFRDCVEAFILQHDVIATLIDTVHFSELPQANREQAILRITRGLRQLALSSARYRCTSCGYSTQRLIWHCPSCKAWETIRPIQAFQFERLVA